MRLPSFTIANQRSVRLAACDCVPKLMIIAGPNGAGKSTLLNALRQQPGHGAILYVGPHRNSRKQKVRWQHLLNQPISLEDLLAGQNIPRYEGIEFITGQRDPWSFDDTGNYLKHGLCQIEVDRKDAIALLYDKEHEIRRDSLPDPWQPLKELTNNLLPHLTFVRIDTTDKNQVRVLWNVHAKDATVDFDELSSGEKAVIQIFYPLVEARIKAILAKIQHAAAATAQPETCVLIDEPELHLHPNLQVKVLDYLRLLTTTGKFQLIIATHSPTIVEHASFEELYLLRPVEMVAAGDNQLIQVASNEERLAFLRDVFGTTSNLTAMQSVVVVEGAEQREGSKTVSDRKLYRALHPGFDRVTLVPGGGKAECIKLRASLEQAIKSFSSTVTAVALLDRDIGTNAPENITYLPVSMIENFLIDPQSIWEALQSVIESTPFKSMHQVSNAIDAILDEFAALEIERRTLCALGTAFFRPKSVNGDISHQALQFAESLKAQYSHEAVTQARVYASDQVKKLKESFERREFFHGKDVLSAFVKKHLHPTGMKTSIFYFEAARHARNRKKVVQFFDSFFARAFPDANIPVVGTNT